MTYNKIKIGPLIMFLGFMIGMFLIMFIGVNDVFAAEYPLTYETYQRYYDNTGTLSQVDSTWNESLLSYVSGNLTTVADSTGAAWLVSSPVPMLKDHQYSISFAFEDRNNIALSSKNKISISNTVNGAVTAYNNSTYNADTLYSKVTSNTILSFIFKANTNSSFIVIPWTTTSRVTQNYVVTKIIMEDLGSSGLSEEQLNSTINNQTNELNNSIQNSTDTIINNQNQNNEELKDTINENFNSCRDSYNLLNVPYDYSVTGVQIIDMELEPGTYTLQTDEINIGNDQERSVIIFFYQGDQTYASPVYMSPDMKKKSFNINEKVYRVRIYSGNNYNNSQGVTTTYKGLMLAKGNYNGNYEPYGEEICSNKIDETNDKLDGIQGALTDSSPTDMSGLGDSAGWLPPGPVDSILNLPLTFFLNLSESLSSECRPVELTLPFVDKKIYLPCIRSLYDQMGVTGTIFTTAGIIASAIILYNYLLALYKWVDDTLTLRENTMPGYYDDKWGGGA